MGYDAFEFADRQNFLFLLGSIVLLLLIVSNLFKGMTTWLTLRYDNHLYYKLGRRLLTQYLTRPYVFFLNRNTSEIVGNKSGIHLVVNS